MEEQKTTAQEVVEQAKKNAEARQQNTEGVTLKNATQETIQGLNDTTKYSEKVAQQGTTEPNQNITSSPFFKKLDERFSVVEDEIEGFDNKTYTVGGNDYIVTKNSNGTVSITNKNNREDTQVLNTEDDAVNFLLGKETSSGSDNSRKMEALPREDGVVADKDKNSGKIIEEKKVPLVHNESEFLDYYKKYIKGTELEKYLSKDDAYEIARVLGNFNFDRTGHAFEFHFGESYTDPYTNKTVNTYGVNDLGFRDNLGRITNPDLNQLEKNGVKNAILKLYTGADAITAVHEIAHIGYWNMTKSER